MDTELDVDWEYGQTDPNITGLVISEPYTVIAYTHLSRGGRGEYPHGVCIAYAPALEYNEPHPYVVWTAVYRSDVDVWQAYHGTYCRTITEAFEEYKFRRGV